MSHTTRCWNSRYVRSFAVFLPALAILTTGCGMDRSVSRVEQLNDAIRRLNEKLQKVTDVESSGKLMAGIQDTALEAAELQDKVTAAMDEGEHAATYGAVIERDAWKSFGSLRNKLDKQITRIEGIDAELGQKIRDMVQPVLNGGLGML